MLEPQMRMANPTTCRSGSGSRRLPAPWGTDAAGRPAGLPEPPAHLQHVEALPASTQAEEPDEQCATSVDGGTRRARQALGHCHSKHVEQLCAVVVEVMVCVGCVCVCVCVGGWVVGGGIFIMGQGNRRRLRPYHPAAPPAAAPHPYAQDDQRCGPLQREGAHNLAGRMRHGVQWQPIGAANARQHRQRQRAEHHAPGALHAHSKHHGGLVLGLVWAGRWAGSRATHVERTAPFCSFHSIPPHL